MNISLHHVGPMLVCEICEGEVDLLDGSETATCRHCGIAFAIDAPPAVNRRIA